MNTKKVEWSRLFPVFMTFIVMGDESRPDRKPASFASCFSLLHKRFVALMSLAIFLMVGSEVAINSNIANILVARYEITLETAVIGISIFYAGETISRLLGGIILNWIAPQLFLLLKEP